MGRLRAVVSMTADSDDAAAAARDEIRAMRIRQIKDELEQLGGSSVGAFEKEDLVERLMNAREIKRAATTEEAEAADAKPPSMGEAMKQADILMADADGPELMEKLQKDPRLMQAVMDISMNGDASKYKDDAEVMDLMRKLEAITKRGMAEETYDPFPDELKA